MFDFGLYTQVSDSGPYGPLVCQRVWKTVKNQGKVREF